MDVAKVAKDYFLSSQSTLLIPNREYGSRKLIHIGLGRSSSAGSIKVDSGGGGGGGSVHGNGSGSGNGGGSSNGHRLSHHYNHSEPGTPTSGGGRVAGLKGLLVGSIRQRNQAIKSSGNKQWLHPPDALLKGHILYSVKFLGECKVEQPKGTDIVKSAITKMKFNKHIKRAEGHKPPKVELIISSEAVKVIDPKTKVTMHQYPLHRISYCADDKSDKRMFTFIGKAANTNDHFCYVFDSEKCAEEITLTVGQAFDLAYKKFVETSTLDNDVRKQLLALQKRAQNLQFENDELKKRITQLEHLKDRSDLEEYMRNNQIQDLSSVKLNLQESSTDDNFTVAPQEKQKSVVGRRLENLILSDDHSPSSSSSPNHHSNGNQQSFPSSHGNITPVLSPPPPNNRQHRGNNSASARSNGQNLTNNNFSSAGQTVFDQTDPFGMPAFNPTQESQSQSQSQSQPELIDMQAGFSRGLTFGTDDFSVEDFDPLNQRL